MQGGFKYKGVSNVKIPTYKPPKPILTERQELTQNLETQYQNLGKRLEAVGANQIVDNRSFLEKMFNLADDQNAFMDIIEVIERPMRAIQSGMIAASRGESIGQGLIAGITGQKKFTGVEFADEMGWLRKEDLSGAQTFLLNMGIDILFDPFTYFSPLKMVGKAFKKGGQTVDNIVGITNKAMKEIQEDMVRAGLDVTQATADDWIKFGAARNHEIILNGANNKNVINRFGKAAPGTDNVFVKVQSKSSPGKKFEGQFGQLLGTWLKKHTDEGLDFWVGLEKTANQMTDAKIFRQIKLADGSLVSMSVRNIEIKDLIGSAFGANKLGLAINETGQLVIKETGNFNKLTPELKEGLNNILKEINDQAAKSGQTVGEYISKNFGSNVVRKSNLEKAARSGLTKIDEAWALQNVDGFAQLTLKEQTDLLADLNKASSSALDWAKSNVNNFDKLSPEEQMKILRSTRRSGDTKFGSWIQRYIKGEAGEVSMGLNAETLASKWGVDKETANEFFGLISELSTSSKDAKWYGFIDAAGELQMMKGENLLNYLTPSASLGFSTTGPLSKAGTKAKRLELMPQIKLEDAALNDETFKKLLAADNKEFLDGFLLKNTSEPDGIVLRMLNGLKESKITPVRKLASAADFAIERIGFAFNWGKGLADQFKKSLRGIGGKVGLQMQRQSARLDSLVSKYKDTPQAQSMIRQLIESGAKIDPQTGQVVVENFTPKMLDIINNIKLNVSKNQTALMGTWGKTGKELDLFAKNLQDQLNTLYKNKENVKNAFKVTVKDGAVGVTLDAIDAKTLNKISFDDVTDLFTGGGTYKLTDQMKEFFLKNADDVNEIKKLQHEILDLLKKEGKYDVMNELLSGAPGYFRHSLSSKAKEFLKKQRPAARSKYIQEGIDMMTKRTYMGTVDDVNKGMKAFYGIDFDFFDTGLKAGMEDLITIAGKKSEQWQILDLIIKSSDEAGQPLFQVIDNTVDAAEELGHGFVAIKKFDEVYSDIYKNLSDEAKDILTKHIDSLGYDVNTSALAIHRSAKNLLDNVNSSFKEIPNYIRGYDKLMNVWKSITLVTPGFHMRNLFGNMANMTFAGMNIAQQSKYATKAMGDFGVYKRLSGQLAQFSGTYDDFLSTLTKTDADAFKRVTEFFESGVSQSYAGVRDLAGVNKLLQEGGQNVGKRLVGVNFDIAEHMDDFQRYMLYQWSLDAGLKKYARQAGLEAWQVTGKAQVEAQQKVAESLFDYKHFTSFEQEAMKRVFPFYTFFKNNLVFQMQSIFKNPGAVGRMGRAYKYASEDLAGVDLESMPDYATGNMWLPIPAEITKNDTEAIAFLKLNLPLSDFTELVEDPLKRGVSSVAAPVKLLFELGMGVDSFTGSPITSFEGEQDRMDSGSGVLSNLRNEDGDFALSASPVMQKIANDIGLRVPREYLSVLLDVADGVSGEQPTEETLFDVLDRFGLTATKEVEDINLTRVYKLLEDLRTMQKQYEQTTGTDLPTKAELDID